MREVRADEQTSMHLAVFLTAEEVLAHGVFEDRPTDLELGGLYEDAIDGEVGGGMPPKRILVEDGATAKRVRSLFKRGARIEIERAVTAAIDALSSELIDLSVDHELFEALPVEWKPELIALGDALSRSSPWSALPPRILRATIPSLGVADVELALMGRTSLGFVVYPDSSTRQEFLLAGKTGRPFPRVAGLELVDILIDDALVRVAAVEARGARGREDPTEAEIELCATLAHLLLAYVEAGPPSDAPRSLEVTVRGMPVRGSLTLVGG